jgi:hypothetical protein
MIHGFYQFGPEWPARIAAVAEAGAALRRALAGVAVA